MAAATTLAATAVNLGVYPQAIGIVRGGGGVAARGFLLLLLLFWRVATVTTRCIRHAETDNTCLMAYPDTRAHRIVTTWPYACFSVKIKMITIILKIIIILYE